MLHYTGSWTWAAEYGLMAGSCEQSNEPSRRGSEYVDHLNDNQLLKDSASGS